MQPQTASMRATHGVLRAVTARCWFCGYGTGLELESRRSSAAGVNNHIRVKQRLPLSWNVSSRRGIDGATMPSAVLESRPRPAGASFQQRTAASYNTPDAIIDAVANMAFGDVLLLEAQETDPVGGAYFWPVEIADATYDAIRLATALGIVVVEAGCNGSYDLDSYTNLSGKKIFDRTSADFRNSGQSWSAPALPPLRTAVSDFLTTAIVSIAMHGEKTSTQPVQTALARTIRCIPVFLTAHRVHRRSSLGQSLIVQAIAQTSLGYRFSPRALRKILTTNGTASATPATDKIGVMPDLRANITGNQINLAPDLYLRDYVGNSGNPTSGMVSSSPDIIVRQAAVANPAASYGAGSGTENNPALSQDVNTGHDNFVYVRLLNRGGSELRTMPL